MLGLGVENVVYNLVLLYKFYHTVQETDLNTTDVLQFTVKNNTKWMLII